MRSSTWFLFFCLFFVCFNSALWWYSTAGQKNPQRYQFSQQLVAALGLTDLCLATDARYIRHLSVSDPLSPYMNHPGAIEYFPSSVIYVPR